MDVGRLSETLSWMRSQESSLKIQEKLAALQSALQNLSGNPGEQSYQIQLTKTMKDLVNAVEKFQSNFDPAELARISEIGGDPYFTSTLTNSINKEIVENAMSPASALSFVTALLEERRLYIERVTTTEVGVDSFVEYGSSLAEGEAVLGFEIPREIFDNEFKDFISELRTILRIVRVFSELECGSMPEIKLGNLSSTDPLIFLNAPPVIVASIAGVISWILSEWKKIEEIRKLRAETSKISGFDKKEIEEFFDKKIQTTLDKIIEEKVSTLIENGKLSAARKNELDSEMNWALKALFARIERGMRVEVETKLIAKSDDAELTPSQQKNEEVLKEVQRVRSELSFPVARDSSILSLPKTPDREFDEGKRAPPRQKRQKPTI